MVFDVLSKRRPVKYQRVRNDLKSGAPLIKIKLVPIAKNLTFLFHKFYEEHHFLGKLYIISLAHINISHDLRVLFLDLKGQG